MQIPFVLGQRQWPYENITGSLTHAMARFALVEKWGQLLKQPW